MVEATQSIHIQEATLEDVDDIVPLFDAYRVFYEQPSNVQRARIFLMSRLRNKDSVIYLARNDAGEAVGFTQLYPSFSSVSVMPLWILNDLFVAPSGRRQGVGGALIERAKQLARDTRAAGLSLATATDNLTAQSLYESIGFARDEKFFHYFLPLDPSS